MALATKLLRMILFVAFLQNGSQATNLLDSLYQKMYTELYRQSDMDARAVRKDGEAWLPVLSNLEMGRHIYAKIDLLGGILAELNAKRDQMGAEREYFLNENAMEKFLEFVKQKEGADHQQVEFFSDFPIEKFGNREFFLFVTDKNWVMDELLGGKYPDEFFGVLDRIMEMLSLEKNDSECAGLPPATCRALAFRLGLIKFIEKMKLEIVIGQTFDDFMIHFERKIQADNAEIQNKIDEEGPKGISKSKLLKPYKAYKSHQQRALFEKYKHLNEVSLKLYNALKTQIPEMIRKKAKKEGFHYYKQERRRLASEVKTEFAEVMPETLAVSTSSSVSTKRTLWELIENDLRLPEQWLEKQKKLFADADADSEARLRSMIHMNTAMLLLAFERTAIFFDQ